MLASATDPCEDRGDAIGRDACTSVGDVQDEPVGIGRHLSEADLDATRLGELEGVAYEVEDDLREATAVTDATLDDPGLCARDEREPLAASLGSERPEDFGERLVNRERAVVELDGIRLGARDVEDVVEQREEHARGLLGRLDLLAYGRRRISLQGHVGHGDDAVEGRPDLVAHVGEEAGLDEVRALERSRGLGEIARALLRDAPERPRHPEQEQREHQRRGRVLDRRFARGIGEHEARLEERGQRKEDERDDGPDDRFAPPPQEQDGEPDERQPPLRRAHAVRDGNQQRDRGEAGRPMHGDRGACGRVSPVPEVERSEGERGAGVAPPGGRVPGRELHGETERSEEHARDHDGHHADAEERSPVADDVFARFGGHLRHDFQTSSRRRRKWACSEGGTANAGALYAQAYLARSRGGPTLVGP